MKVINTSFFYDNNSVKSEYDSLSIINNNNRYLITTSSFAPYCTMCGGTGRCGGSCNG